MARTQARDYEQRRQRILDTAAQLFARNGFHNTAIADVAKECGISKSLLYHYFTSKEEILFAAMEDHVLLLRETGKGIVEGKGSAREKFQAITRAFLDIYKNAQARHAVLLGELKALDPKQQRRIVKTQREVVGIFNELIAEMMQGAAEARSLRTVLTMLFLGMINWTHTWYDPNGALKPADLADLAAAIFALGLRDETIAALSAALPEIAVAET